MKILSANKLTDLKWLNLFDVSYRDRSGRDRKWQVATRAGEPKCISGRFAVADAVVIVPFHTSENKLVITREYRVPLADFEYGFPAGLIDEGESLEQAVSRELKEETGLTLTRIIDTSPPLYSSAGMTDESVAMVTVECDGRPSDAGNTASESIEVEFVSPSRAASLCANPGLKFDVKAWLVLYQFSQTGRLFS